MRSTFTWVMIILMVELAAAQRKDFVVLTPDPSQHRLRAPCSQFHFTCTINVSLIQRPVRTTATDPALVLYLVNHGTKRNQFSCHGDKRLDNTQWGGAVWTIRLTADMTYRSTGILGRTTPTSTRINAGIIAMTPDDVNFRFTIYKLRRHLGKHPWCFTCRLEFQPMDKPWFYVDHKTVEMEVADDHGYDKSCNIQEGLCHLPRSVERLGFQYQRKISDSECTICTCRGGGAFECTDVTSYCVPPTTMRPWTIPAKPSLWMTEERLGKRYRDLQRPGNHVGGNQKACKDLGAFLPEPKSKWESDFLRKLTKTPFRLGMRQIRDFYGNQVWVWDRSRAGVAWHNWIWFPTERYIPLNTVRRCAAMVHVKENSGWIDVDCESNEGTDTVVCEKAKSNFTFPNGITLSRQSGLEDGTDMWTMNGILTLNFSFEDFSGKATLRTKSNVVVCDWNLTVTECYRVRPTTTPIDHCYCTGAYKPNNVLTVFNLTVQQTANVVHSKQTLEAYYAGKKKKKPNYRSCRNAPIDICSSPGRGLHSRLLQTWRRLPHCAGAPVLRMSVGIRRKTM